MKSKVYILSSTEVVDGLTVAGIRISVNSGAGHDAAQGILQDMFA